MGRRRLRKITLVWIGVAAACTAPAAADTESDVQQWTSVRINHPIGDRWAVSLASEVRFDDDVSDYKSFSLKPAVHVAFARHWHLGLGYKYEDKDGGSDEQAAWQEAAFAQSFGKLALGHRLRLEERFIEGIGGVIARSRYRLKAAHPLWSSPWYLVGSEEVLVNLNNQGEGPVSGFEQNRLFAGLGLHLGRHVRAELGYLWRFERERSGPDRSDHIISLSLFFDTRAKLLPLHPAPHELHH
jgi:hypothetical protein